MAFRILGLPAEDFAHLFELSDLDLGLKAECAERSMAIIPAALASRTRSRVRSSC
jgi:hypothetical protein